ncbi:MAG: PAS domain S-box protein [Dehalococcoidales bacterium]|nr:PAS domain S-box protein [Dehalococcoidales bacterium]
MSRKEETISNVSTKDVTEHNQTGQMSGESEGLYRSMIELSPDGIVAVDAKGALRVYNAAAARMTGYLREEMIGKHFSKLGILRLSDMPKYMKMFASTLRGEIPEPFEMTIPRKDGATVVIEVRVGLIKVGGRIIIQTVFRDITERKQMEAEIQARNEQLDAQNEEELRAANEELQASSEELREAQEQLIRSEKLAVIGQLAGGIGHELRNPLGGMKNAVYYIRGKVVNSGLALAEPRIMEFLDIIDNEIGSSDKIISDLLGFSRVGKPAVSPANIGKVIDGALSRMRIPGNIAVVKQIDSNLPEVPIDDSQIHQVLVNIITNAIQAMPEGGKLSISARKVKESLEVGISDTGYGISPEVRDKVFDPLFTTRAKGIGLGLAVCKTIVERHGGNITVNSKPGAGSTFTIRLPLKVD